MKTETPDRPEPPVLLECPWCGRPLATAGSAATLRCAACSVEVEFAPDPSPDRTAVAPEPPAGIELVAA